MGKMNVVDYIAITLLIVGGLVHGLVGVFNFNLVNWLFGFGTFSRVVFTLVGLSALVAIVRLAYKN